MKINQILTLAVLVLASSSIKSHSFEDLNRFSSWKIGQKEAWLKFCAKIHAAKTALEIKGMEEHKKLMQEFSRKLQQASQSGENLANIASWKLKKAIQLHEKCASEMRNFWMEVMKTARSIDARSTMELEQFKSSLMSDDSTRSSMDMDPMEYVEIEVAE